MPGIASAPGFAGLLVDWQLQHGRHSLPWQNTQDPYRVWLSEIMLQQTQVATVLDYYARFLARFPTVRELAAAHEDEVLGLWSGLGYYSRARNLHRCAQQVVEKHGGEFPRSAAALETLPGIGPSTAAAIASFCFGERVAIFDGNVKRVLGRLFAFTGDLADSRPQRELAAMATQLLPDTDTATAMPRYTQGIMDLGATVCTLRKPRCEACPVQRICLGFASGAPERFPVKTRKLKRSAQQLSLLWAERADGAVWLERRPATGIWGGLYCLPVFDGEATLQAAVSPGLRDTLQPVTPFVHVLTHKDLYLFPMRLHLSVGAGSPLNPEVRDAAASTAGGAWFAADVWPGLGLPAPIRKLLEGGQDRQLSL
ncbi:MAG: A/G-specific adenine glycosylase [Polaromonas sp.]|nr:A/G-specific adenine glycosylase [Polaromonas sp.]